MKNLTSPYLLRRLGRGALAIAVCLSASGSFSEPREFRIGALTVSALWTRATPKGAEVAAGYLSITNTGTNADRLMGGSARTASRFELHEMATADGVMKMREITTGIEIKPGGILILKPGGFHIMMTGLREPVQEGAKISGTLIFEKAGQLEVEFIAAGMGAGAPAAQSHGQAH